MIVNVYVFIPVGFDLLIFDWNRIVVTIIIIKKATIILTLKR